jgi:membrane protein DedA with SNARE-associated domain
MATSTAGLDTLLHNGSLVYLGLFLAALIDATGFPFPGRALLVAAGDATARDWGQVALMTAAGALGALVGDHLWYAAGRLGAADRLTRLYGKLSRTSGRCEAQGAHSRFDRLGPLAIVIGRFVAGVRLFAAPMAGGGAISYPRFLLFGVIGAVAWSGLFVAAGYALGAPARALIERHG